MAKEIKPLDGSKVSEGILEAMNKGINEVVFDTLTEDQIKNLQTGARIVEKQDNGSFKVSWSENY